MTMDCKRPSISTRLIAESHHTSPPLILLYSFFSHVRIRYNFPILLLSFPVQPTLVQSIMSHLHTIFGH